MSEKTAQDTISEQGEVLQAFSRTLDREAHVLTKRPDLLWQQIYNRLQWLDGDKGGSVSKTILPQFEKRFSPGAKRWLHNKIRTMGSETFIGMCHIHLDNYENAGNTFNSLIENGSKHPMVYFRN